MYGNKYMGIIRTSYVIDAQGKVAAVFPKVQPKQHDKKVLKALAEL
jgi:peroxiredoxin Q/BCP